MNAKVCEYCDAFFWACSRCGGEACDCEPHDDCGNEEDSDDGN